MNLRWLVLVLATTGMTRAAEITNASAVLEFVLQQSARFDSFAADFVQTQWVMGEPTKMTGTIQFQKPANTRLSMELIVAGGVPQRVVNIMGADQVLWQETISTGSPTVMKTDMTHIPTNHPATALLKNPFETVDPQRFITRIQRDYTQTLTGTAELHSQKMYVLEGVLKSNQKLPAHLAVITRGGGRQRLHIGQTDGFVHQVEQFDTSHTNLVMTIEFTNLKLNPALPVDLFQYEPPAGARVIDMTAILLQMMKSNQKK